MPPVFLFSLNLLRIPQAHGQSQAWGGALSPSSELRSALFSAFPCFLFSLDTPPRLFLQTCILLHSGTYLPNTVL